MAIWYDAFIYSAHLVLKVGSVMFFSLFGMELLMQLGAMKKMAPLGKPITRLSGLPVESALTFIASIGSLVAGNTMIAQYHSDGQVSGKEMVLSAILNTVPLHFRETLTFHFPVILPLLGWKLFLIYTAAFWLTGLLKLLLVIGWGRLILPAREGSHRSTPWPECPPHAPDCKEKNLKTLVIDAFHARRSVFLRMVTVLGCVTFLVQLLARSGAMAYLHRFIHPLSSALGLPAQVIGPISAYILSPTVGITYMANLIDSHAVTGLQAMIALMVAGLIMIPVMRLRGTLPRYTAIFGLQYGPLICLITMGISMLARLIVLAALLIIPQEVIA